MLRTPCSAALVALWRGLSLREPVSNVQGLFRSKHIQQETLINIQDSATKISRTSIFCLSIIIIIIVFSHCRHNYKQRPRRTTDMHRER